MKRSAFAALGSAVVVAGAMAACGGGGSTSDAGTKDANVADVVREASAVDGNASDAANLDATSVDEASADATTTDSSLRDGGADGASVDASGGFVHPGILVDSKQLAFVAAHLGSDPWKTALAKVKASRFAATTYKASPVADVKCDSFSKDPDSGATETACTTQIDDGIAAYTDALLWVLTGESSYAATGVAILNAWTKTLTQMTGSNAPLQSAWFGEMITRAAEIFRHTSSGYAASDAAAFGAMMTKVILPRITNGSPGSNGNWELSMSDAVMDLGIYEDDHAVFEHGVAMWRARVPAYVYMTGDTDGGLPVPPPGGDYSTPTKLTAFWFGMTQFVDGLCQETCRDFGHVQLGFSSMVNAAETARIQGVDLWEEQQSRIAAAYEFHSQYLEGATPPSWLCKGTVTLSTIPTWEIGYNAMATRDGLSLPHSLAWVTKIRPTDATLQMAWETLTHAETGDAGDP